MTAKQLLCHESLTYTNGLLLLCSCWFFHVIFNDMIKPVPKMFFFFIDGVGLSLSESNPLKSLFASLIQNKDFCLQKGLDAVMGVKGLPQSATGQTSIFTGINAQKYLGYHLNAFPNEKLIPLIQERSLMKTLAQKGFHVDSANLYSRQYFETRKIKHKNAFSVSTLTIEASGIPFHMIGDEKPAIYADITGELLFSRGIDFPSITVEQAAEKTSYIVNQNDFTLFEYFLTDYFGHKKDVAALNKEIQKLNQFTDALLPLLDPTCAILIVSDHGNAEDMTTADHTENPALFLFYSQKIEQYRERLKKISMLSDVYDFVLDYFGKPV